MHRLGFRLVTLAFLFGLTGCGGGLSEGFPANASQGLTPAQEEQQQELMAQEKAQAELRKTEQKAEQAKREVKPVRRAVRKGA